VLQCVGSVAYWLELPPSSSIHPVFHVSQLKKAVGTGVQVSDSLLDEMSQLQLPEKILDCHLVNQGVKTVQQVLVKWSSTDESMATWENLEALRQQFPSASTWGQAGSRGGAIVSTDGSVVGSSGESVGRPQVRRPNPKVTGPEWVS
jgi:hypothetical protein